MHPTLRSFPIAVTTALVLSAALWSSSVSAQETIPLAFGWEPGLRATVTQTTSQSAGGAGAQIEQMTITTYNIETAEHPEGLVIRYRDGQLVESRMPQFENVPGGPEFIAAVASASYDVIVDGDGELLRVERDDATTEALRAALEEMAAPIRSMPGSEGMVELFEQVMSDGVLNAEVHQNWNSAVALWAGKEVLEGETYTRREEAPLPMMDNRTLLTEIETTLRGRTACAEGGAADGCVRLEVRSSVDPDDLRPAIEEMFGQVIANTSMEIEISLGEIQQSSLSEVIVEPSTLLPHSVSVSGGTEAEMTVMGQTVTTVQSMETLITYEWQAR